MKEREELNRRLKKYKNRGKRKDNGEWGYGHLFYGKGEKGQLETFIVSTEYECHNNRIDLDTCASWEVIPETVGHYTGLKDKNGTEIYEGDILLAPSWFENLICICIYQQENEVSSIQGFGLYSYDNYFQKYQNLIESDEWEEFEVIGNVHDNAELLEVEDERNGISS